MRRVNLLKFHSTVGLDLSAIVCAYFLAYYVMPYVRFIFIPHEIVELMPIGVYAWLLFIILPLFCFLQWLNGVYINLQSVTKGQLFWRIGLAGGEVTTIIIFVLFAGKIYYSRLLIFLIGLLSIMLVFGLKLMLRQLAGIALRQGAGRRRTLIIGSKKRAQELVVTLSEQLGFSYEVLGFLEVEADRVGKSYKGVPVIGLVDDFEKLAIDLYVNEVFITLPFDLLPSGPELLKFADRIGLKVSIVPDFGLLKYDYRPKVAKMEFGDFLGFPLLSFETTPRYRAIIIIKEIVDRIVAGGFLVLLSPLFLAIAVAVRRSSPGPIFYRWKVLGQNNRKFIGYKFRTMVENADSLKKDLMHSNEMGGVVFKMQNDPRVTPSGRFLRRYSLDELPQLWSVLKGDMSLVGPRPPLVSEGEHFEFWQRRKLSVKPGITCLWQVNGRSEIKDFREWLKLDFEYIDNWSLWLDLKIFLKTILVVLNGRGAN